MELSRGLGLGSWASQEGWVLGLGVRPQDPCWGPSFIHDAVRTHGDAYHSVDTGTHGDANTRLDLFLGGSAGWGVRTERTERTERTKRTDAAEPSSKANVRTFPSLSTLSLDLCAHFLASPPRQGRSILCALSAERRVGSKSAHIFRMPGGDLQHPAKCAHKSREQVEREGNVRTFALVQRCDGATVRRCETRKRCWRTDRAALCRLGGGEVRCLLYSACRRQASRFCFRQQRSVSRLRAASVGTQKLDCTQKLIRSNLRPRTSG